MPYRKDADWARLATYAKARRDELGLTQRDTAVEARLSTNGYRAIEDGTAVRASTLEAAERGLRWASGSARSVLHGGEPTPLIGAASSTTMPVPAGSHALPPQLRAALAAGEVFDVEVVDLKDGLGQAVLIGLVSRDVPDSRLMEVVREFQPVKDRMTAR